jgi:S-adenosylmethionine hydrolase
MRTPAIALLTDFGIYDPFVGIMKGVISSIAPEVPLIDLTHQISPGDIQQAAYYLWQASRDLPPDTIFLAVVDPGVGTDRKAIYLKRDQQIFIGPDNGLFSYLGFKSQLSAWELSNPEYRLDSTSATFHGRDIFAPAAAYAANGIAGAAFGEALENIQLLDRPLLQISSQAIQGEIISTDRFGNLITSLGTFRKDPDGLVLTSWVDTQGTSLSGSAELSVRVQDQALPVVSTFAEIPIGECAGLIGSTGLLEIVSNLKSAADLLSLGRGARVSLSWS